MEEEEYHNELQSIVLLARMVRPIKALGVLQAMEHAATVGPILDPTLYIEEARKMDLRRRIVEAILRFQQEIEKVVSEWDSDFA